MKKYKMGALSAATVTLLCGCFGGHLSRNISNEGTIEQADIVFPDTSKAWQKDGQFVNSENLRMVKAGVNKADLYHLIGAPHFGEIYKAREWDYLFKFYRPDESIQLCQYKIIFDKDYTAQQFYWQPADCVNYVKPLPEDKPPVMTAVPVMTESLDLSVDAMFAFDKFAQKDMLPQGRSQLDALAQKIRRYDAQGLAQVKITGHTDYLGDEMYNHNLSLLRAQTVRNYLVDQGINPKHIWATGMGEIQPAVSCAKTLPKRQLIECLQPNRRVEVQVSVYDNQ